MEIFFDLRLRTRKDLLFDHGILTSEIRNGNLENMRGFMTLRLVLCLWIGSPLVISGFQRIGFAQISTTTGRHRIESSSRSSPLLLAASSNKDNDNKPEYSREIYLREEAESPFRKVRIFFYYSVGAGALLGLAISSALIYGINADLLPESGTNHNCSKPIIYKSIGSSERNFLF
jgi:hypothetical protein